GVFDSASGQYSLVVTKNATFDIEPNDEPGQRVQDVGATGIVLGAAASGGSGSADSASGAVGLGINLVDGNGFLWDIQPDGQINNGTDDAYDGGLRHNGFPWLSSGSSEMNGREIIIGPATIGQVRVTRKIYVPDDQGFARFLEIVTSTSAMPVEYTLGIHSNLGWDFGTRLVGTSLDDGIWDTQDDWVVTGEPGDGGNWPTLLHVLAGKGGSRPASVSLNRDNMDVRYNLLLAPGETQIVLHFAAQNVDRATALAKGPRLADLELDALAGVSVEEGSQIVNFALADTDVYSFEASAGDVLSISTSLPADGLGQFVNELDVAIELFDPNGQLVASDASGSLTHPAALGGTYSVRILAENDTAGEYVLGVTGYSGALPPFVVAATTPADGARFLLAPTVIRVDLSDQVLLTSVEASDLTVDGVAAAAVTIVDGDTLVFALRALVEGVNHVSIASGALVDLEGQPIEVFAGELVVDTTPPRVIGSSIQENDTVPAGVPLAVTIRFDEALNTAALDSDDVRLAGQNSGEYTATALAYEPATSTLTVEFEALPEDQYTLTLVSGDGALEDLLG
ncbi:MAG: pre-peptidase C-terminal domain-containing protein, partial [Pirellulales bacterium]